MSLTPIQAAIPHRDPFLLIDKIVEQEESRIVCQTELSGDEFWFRGHYPDFPLMPGVLLCEAAMQAGAVLLSTYADGEGVPVATRMRDVRFKRMVRPGETITLEVTLDEKVSQAFFLTARVTVAKELAMRMKFTCTLAKISEPAPNPEKTA